jgi:hypothetical protein
MMNFKFAKYRIAVSNCDHRGFRDKLKKAGEELAKGKKLNGQNI